MGWLTDHFNSLKDDAKVIGNGLSSIAHNPGQVWKAVKDLGTYVKENPGRASRFALKGVESGIVGTVAMAPLAVDLANKGLKLINGKWGYEGSLEEKTSSYLNTKIEKGEEKVGLQKIEVQNTNEEFIKDVVDGATQLFAAGGLLGAFAEAARGVKVGKGAMKLVEAAKGARSGFGNGLNVVKEFRETNLVGKGLMAYQGAAPVVMGVGQRKIDEKTNEAFVNQMLEADAFGGPLGDPTQPAAGLSSSSGIELAENESDLTELPDFSPPVRTDGTTGEFNGVGQKPALVAKSDAPKNTTAPENVKGNLTNWGLQSPLLA